MILYDINVLEIYIRYLSLYLNICFFPFVILVVTMTL